MEIDWSLLRDSGLSSLGYGFEEGLAYRSVRFNVRALLGAGVRAKVSADTAIGGARLRDLYVERGGPLGVRAGLYREPMGIEAHTRRANLLLLERSSATNAFTPARNVGLGVRADSGPTSFFLGAFRESDTNGRPDSPSGEAVTGRLVVAHDHAHGWWQVEGSYSRRWSDEGFAFSSRPEVRAADPLLDTGLIMARRSDVTGVGGVVTLGPALVQAEAFSADVGGASLHGGYVLASCLVTGGRRTRQGRKASVGPVVSAAWAGKHRADSWELGARFSRTDLDDGAVQGGELDDVAIGLSWIPSPRLRVAANYVRADLDGAGDLRAVVLRVRMSL